MSEKCPESRSKLVDFLAEMDLQGIVLDAAGRITYANAQARSLLALPETSTPSASLDSILSPRNPEWLAREIRKSCAESGWSGDVILRGRKAGEKWAHIQACRLPGSTSGELLLLFEDATERVKTMQELKENTEALCNRYWEIDLLHRVASVMLSEADLNERLRLMLREASESVGAQCSGVFVRSEPEHRLVCTCVYGEIPQSLIGSLAVDYDERSLTARSAMTRRASVSNDFSNAPEEVLRLVTKMGIKSIAAVPMIAGGEAIGTICFGDSRHVRGFTRPEIRLLETIASCAAAAIRDAEMAAQVQAPAAVEAPVARCAAPETVEAVIGLCRTHPSSRGRVLANLVPEDLPNIDASDAELRDTLLNLVLNALQATKPGGVVSVEGEFHETDNTIDLRVVDNGCGMPEEVMEHAFEPFYTTKDAGGLGLYASAEAVRRMGGSIIVDSRPGEGTVLTVRLNAVREQQSAERRRAA